MSRRGEKLALLLVLGALLINFPLLAIFNRPATLGGVPILYVYLFAVWTAGILAVFLLTRKQGDEQG